MEDKYTRDYKFTGKRYFSPFEYSKEGYTVKASYGWAYFCLITTVENKAQEFKCHYNDIAYIKREIDTGFPFWTMNITFGFSSGHEITLGSLSGDKDVLPTYFLIQELFKLYQDIKAEKEAAKLAKSNV